MMQEIIFRYTENLAALRLYVEWIGKFISDNVDNEVFSQESPQILQLANSALTQINEQVNELAVFDKREIILKGDYQLPNKQAAKLIFFKGLEDAAKRELFTHFVESARREYKGEPFYIFYTEVDGTPYIQFAPVKALSLESQRFVKSKELLYRSSLITLTSMVEWFLAELISYERRQITAYNDDEIEQEVSRILRSSKGKPKFYEICSLATKMRIKNSDLFIEYEKQIIEVFLRRNCLAHNAGRINEYYIEKVGNNELKVGDELKVDSKYLLEAIDLLEIGFVFFAAELWKKLDKKDESRGEILLTIVFNHQCKERWHVSEQIAQFVQADQFLPDHLKTEGQLDYWLSVKKQNRYEEIRDEIQKADFSTKEPVHQLCHLALVENVSGFFQLVPDVWSSDEEACAEIEKWPIYHEMKKFPEYEKLKPATIDDKSEGLVN